MNLRAYKTVKKQHKPLAYNENWSNELRWFHAYSIVDQIHKFCRFVCLEFSTIQIIIKMYIHTN